MIPQIGDLIAFKLQPDLVGIVLEHVLSIDNQFHGWLRIRWLNLNQSHADRWRPLTGKKVEVMRSESLVIIS